MAILTAHCDLDLAELPTRDDRLRLRYSAQVVNGRNTLTLLHANSEPGYEPKYVRFMIGLTLKLGDRTLAQGAGQLVLTSHRILGMITPSGSPKLDVPSPVHAFAVDVADVTDPEGSSNWRGKAVEATVRSGASLAFSVIFHSLKMEQAR
jgi:hypothetical protein